MSLFDPVRPEGSKVTGIQCRFFVKVSFSNLQQKYSALPDYYKFILVTVLILMTVIEAIRLYLGYVGNLREKIAELAGFWLLSILLQLPQILFQLFNEAILVQPLERGIHIVLALFILTQAVAGFVALRDLVRHTGSQFHLRQFD
ncbi:transmembrane protein 17B isoform X3 [Phyllopteryx taeniolatus]|uniref:transmembrane protein 17B isoform X3 n=1 Tax=Phyllopteryx taeniolatus TaxID=161469 RepID=UPI002AD3A441|nr:transmembrane protein 17B isoform X3 [Phyllopteryx taeniolatus]